MEKQYYKLGSHFSKTLNLIIFGLIVLIAAIALAVFWYSKISEVKKIRAQAVSSAQFHFGQSQIGKNKSFPGLDSAMAYLVPVDYITHPQEILPCGLAKQTLITGDYKLVVVKKYLGLPIYHLYTVALSGQTFVHDSTDSSIPWVDQIKIVNLNLSDRKSDEIVLRQYQSCQESADYLYSINPKDKQLQVFSFAPKEHEVVDSAVNFNSDTFVSTGSNTIQTRALNPQQSLTAAADQKIETITWKLSPLTNSFMQISSKFSAE